MGVDIEYVSKDHVHLLLSTPPQVSKSTSLKIKRKVFVQSVVQLNIRHRLAYELILCLTDSLLDDYG